MSFRHSGHGALNPALTAEFATLPQQGKILAEYVWIGGSGEDLRCKTMVLDSVPKDVSELRIWNYDGSSTAQAPGHDSEVLLKPAAIFRDPFRGGDNIIVMCSTYRPDGTPLSGLPAEGGLGGNNNRATAEAIFNHPTVREWSPGAAVAILF
jgi:glutamine synthetase